jgi:hypothetical protein
MTRGNSWETPEWFLELVRRVDDIAFDPCTNSTNPTGARQFVTAEDEPCGLFCDWPDDGLIFINPPFGRGYMDPWVAKIIAEVARGREVVALVRGDSSTRWARELIKASRLICYPPRIKFKGATGSPDFSNAVHYIGPRPRTFIRAFRDLGPIVSPIARRPHSDC